MASPIMNVPLNVGSVKSLGCLNYEKFNPNALQIRRSVSSKPHCSMLAVKACMSNGEYEAKIAGNIHEAQPVLLMPASPARTPEACSSYGPLRKSGMSNEESEAAVVAGNIPEAPPVPPVPASPVGTPVAAFDIRRRPRRNRKSPVLRSAFQETSLRPANFVYPLFIHEGEEDIPIDEIRGCYRLGWRHGLLEEVAKARDVGVNSVLLFPKVPNALKTPTGDEAYNDNGLVPRTIRLLKDKFSDLIIYTDVALDPYSSHGHDGIVREDGVILNDETVYQLCKQAVSQARAGADVVSPSDMMDGRVRAIRSALDAEGFHYVSIMPYTAKYASELYGPFREALDSNPRSGDKKTYQMNPANYREALIEMRENESEGADILLVKPSLHRHIIRLFRDNSPLPIATYQTAGEYMMIKSTGDSKAMDEQKVMMEDLISSRCAGADIIITYFALQAARCLCGEK